MNKSILAVIRSPFRRLDVRWPRYSERDLSLENRYEASSKFHHSAEILCPELVMLTWLVCEGARDSSWHDAV